MDAGPVKVCSTESPRLADQKYPTSQLLMNPTLPITVDVDDGNAKTVTFGVFTAALAEGPTARSIMDTTAMVPNPRRHFGNLCIFPSLPSTRPPGRFGVYVPFAKRCNPSPAGGDMGDYVPISKEPAH